MFCWAFIYAVFGDSKSMKKLLLASRNANAENAEMLKGFQSSELNTNILKNWKET